MARIGYEQKDDGQWVRKSLANGQSSRRSNESADASSQDSTMNTIFMTSIQGQLDLLRMDMQDLQTRMDTGLSGIENSLT